MGDIIKIMKNKDEKLMVVPDQSLIYWQADIDYRVNLVDYYAWMADVPELKSSVEDSFKQNPPTFFYCDCGQSYFGLEKYWSMYEQVIKDGKLTKPLVLKSKLKNLSYDQKDKLRYYNVNVD